MRDGDDKWDHSRNVELIHSVNLLKGLSQTANMVERQKGQAYLGAKKTKANTVL